VRSIRPWQRDALKTKLLDERGLTSAIILAIFDAFSELAFQVA